MDCLTDAAVLNSHNLGMVKTGKAVPRQVLCFIFVQGSVACSVRTSVKH